MHAVSSGSVAVMAVLLLSLCLVPTATAQTETETETAEDLQPDEPLGLFELLDDPLVFIALFVLAAAGLGLVSGSLAIAAWGGYMVFVAFAIAADIQLLTNILYVTLVLIFIGFGFKFWRLEGSGGTT